MTFLPFKGWHLDMMVLTDHVSGILGEYPSKENIERLSAAGLAFTVVVDEGDDVRIIGVVGAVPIAGRDGAAEVFVVASEERRGHQIAFVKAVRRILDHARGRFAIIEAVADEGVKPRWFKWLGFEEAGGRWQLAGEGT